MFSRDLNDRQRAFLMVAVLADPDNTESLLDYFPEKNRGQLAAGYSSLKGQLSKKGKKQILIDELKRLSMESKRSFLSNIHPDWILEALLQERPKMIACILRYLPGEHVRFILERLPEEILGKLPPLMQTFALDPELLHGVRRVFEKKFMPMEGEGMLEEGSFSHIPFLSAEKLKKLFRDLGFREVALAFRTLNEKTVGLILRRLPTQDAVLLKEYLSKVENLPEERLKKAQSHLLSLDLQQGTSESLIIEAGFYVYSKAVLPEHLKAARAIQQKFSFATGRLVKKYIERNLPLNSPETVKPYQEEIEVILQKH